MKAFHVALGIGGIALLVTGTILVRGKIVYNRDAQTIKSLIGELKKIGVPTNGREFFHEIPDSENAWTLVGPVLLNKNGRGNGPLFGSGLATDFVFGAGKEELPLMNKYLAVNESKRQVIRTAILSKPRFQVFHDYDEGAVMLFPELAEMRTVSKDFLLAAYRSAIEGNTKEALQNLDVPVRLSNQCIGRAEGISVLVGNAIHTMILATSLRMVEARPEMLPAIEAYLHAEHRFTPIDFKRLYEERLVGELATYRYLDIPEMDRHKPPFPFNLIAKDQDSDSGKIWDMGKVQHSDYVPKSAAMRKLMRVRLELWVPFMQKVAAQKGPEFATMYTSMPTLSQSSQYFPDGISQLLSLEDSGSEQMFDTLTVNPYHDAVYDVVWKVLENDRATGMITLDPKNLLNKKALGRNGGLTFTRKGKGFILATKDIRDTGEPVYRVSFPFALGKKPESMKQNRKQIDDYRSGKIDYTGSNPKAGQPGPPGNL